MMKRSIAHLRCIPRNWVSVDGNISKICDNVRLRKVEKIYEKMNNEIELNGENKQIRGSCDRMAIVSFIDETMKKDNDDGSSITIKIRYVTQNYQEV